MTDPTRPVAGEDSPDEIERLWWHRLAGKPVAIDGHTKDLEHADLVRQAIAEQYRDDPDVSDLEVEEEGRLRQKMLFEARRRGLIGERQAGSPDERPGATERVSALTDRRRWLGGLAASVMLGLVVVYQLSPNPGDDSIPEEVRPRTRGEVPPQRLTDTDPPRRAESIAAALRQAGAQVRIYPGKKTTWVEIEVLPENFETLKPVLERAGVKAQSGLLIVGIAKP